MHTRTLVSKARPPAEGKEHVVEPCRLHVEGRVYHESVAKLKQGPDRVLALVITTTLSSVRTRATRLQLAGHFNELGEKPHIIMDGFALQTQSK